MRKFLSSLLIIVTTTSFTFSSHAFQIDEKINEILNPISVLVVSIVFFSVEIFEGIKVPLIVVWLIVAVLEAPVSKIQVVTELVRDDDEVPVVGLLLDREVDERVEVAACLLYTSPSPRDY